MHTLMNSLWETGITQTDRVSIGIHGHNMYILCKLKVVYTSTNVTLCTQTKQPTSFPSNKIS